MPIKLICAARTPSAVAIAGHRNLHTGTPEAARVAEIDFVNFQALVLALNPDSSGRAFSDLEVFGDDVDKLIVLTESETLPVAGSAVAPDSAPIPAPGEMGIQAMYFFARNADVYPEDFPVWWRNAHDFALGHAGFSRQMLAHCRANRRCRANDNDGALRRRFGRIDSAVPELVVSLGFHVARDADPFQQYHQALLRYAPAFVDAARSFFVLTE